MVKVTIRLPAALVKLAKVHALGLDEDLQDLVARELWDALRGKEIPLVGIQAAASRGMAATRRAAEEGRKRARSYGGPIKGTK